MTFHCVSLLFAFDYELEHENMVVVTLRTHCHFLLCTVVLLEFCGPQKSSATALVRTISSIPSPSCNLHSIFVSCTVTKYNVYITRHCSVIETNLHHHWDQRSDAAEGSRAALKALKIKGGGRI